MRTLSMDLRERILTAYAQKEGTREEIARRFKVSLGMVKKLLHWRRQGADIGPRYHRCGLRPGKVAAQGPTFGRLLKGKPDLTLEELRTLTALKCSLPAIHCVLEKLGLTYKKRRSGPASKTGRTLSGRASAGGAGKRPSTLPG